MKFCGKCGSEIEPGSKFCSDCGNSVGTSAETDTTPTSPAGDNQPTSTAPPAPTSPVTADSSGGTAAATSSQLSEFATKNKKPIIIVAALIVIAGLAYFFFGAAKSAAMTQAIKGNWMCVWPESMREYSGPHTAAINVGDGTYDANITFAGGSAPISGTWEIENGELEVDGYHFSNSYQSIPLNVKTGERYFFENNGRSHSVQIKSMDSIAFVENTDSSNPSDPIACNRM